VSLTAALPGEPVRAGGQPAVEAVGRVRLDTVWRVLPVRPDETVEPDVAVVMGRGRGQAANLAAVRHPADGSGYLPAVHSGFGLS
jgi:hypothetical protein